MTAATVTGTGATRAAFERRALELAEAKHTTGTARWVGDPMTTREMTVASTTSSAEHLVRAYNGAYSCDCTAGSYGKPCCHVGAMIAALEQRERAMAATDAAEWQRRFDIYGF